WPGEALRATKHPGEALPASGAPGASDPAVSLASPWRPAAYAWAVLALLAGLALTGLVHHRQLQRQRSEQAATQRLLAEKGFAAIYMRLHSAERLLRAVQSLFLSS